MVARPAIPVDVRFIRRVSSDFLDLEKVDVCFLRKLISLNRKGAGHPAGTGQCGGP